MFYNCICNDSIEISSGESCEFCFHVKINGRLPLYATGVTSGFAISHYSDIYMPPLITKPGVLNINEKNTVDSISFSLSSSDTLALTTGKYVYQVCVMDKDGNVDIPHTGFLFVSNNINKAFLKKVEKLKEI